jgi:hypothetical protein
MACTLWLALSDVNFAQRKVCPIVLPPNYTTVPYHNLLVYVLIENSVTIEILSIASSITSMYLFHSFPNKIINNRSGDRHPSEGTFK